MAVCIVDPVANLTALRIPVQGSWSSMYRHYRLMAMATKDTEDGYSWTTICAWLEHNVSTHPCRNGM
eukprot:15324401-Ditylum_brightwellii.AAC.1